jgi:mRNA interferase YafQ
MMTYKLAWTQRFKRGFKKATRKEVSAQKKIFSVLENLCANPFDETLKTHKLHGKLLGLWACHVEYDCRIVFAFEKDPDSENDLIVLIDIGKHDEVY